MVLCNSDPALLGSPTQFTRAVRLKNSAGPEESVTGLKTQPVQMGTESTAAIQFCEWWSTCAGLKS